MESIAVNSPVKSSCFFLLALQNGVQICSGLSAFSTHVLLGKGRLVHIYPFWEISFPRTMLFTLNFFLHLFKFSYNSGIRYGFIRFILDLS